MSKQTERLKAQLQAAEAELATIQAETHQPRAHTPEELEPCMVKSPRHIGNIDITEGSCQDLVDSLNQMAEQEGVPLSSLSYYISTDDEGDRSIEISVVTLIPESRAYKREWERAQKNRKPGSQKSA